MALQFVKKRFKRGYDKLITPQDKLMPERIEKVATNSPLTSDKVTVDEIPHEQVNKKNNKKKNKKDMFDKERINDIEAVVEQLQPEVKVVKADRGLIERTESSKIIITEDNRQVLND